MRLRLSEVVHETTIDESETYLDLWFKVGDDEYVASFTLYDSGIFQTWCRFDSRKTITASDVVEAVEYLLGRSLLFTHEKDVWEEPNVFSIRGKVPDNSLWDDLLRMTLI